MSNIASLPLCILEEIGFEGLEGITLEGLWKRIGVRLKLPLPLNSRLMNDIWKYVQNAKCLQFYELPEDRELLKLFDRSDFIDPFFGTTEPETCPYNMYKYNPISTQDVRGSCEHFDTRVELNKDELAECTLEDIDEKYGLRFIIVASQSLRTSLLIPANISKDIELNISRYCILERVGRARYNGELAHGKYSLNDIGIDPVGFHNQKKTLRRNRLIECQAFTQNIDGTNTAGQLVHLPRFFAQFKPRHMILMEKIISILKSKTNCMAEYHEVKSNFEEGLQRTLSRLFKSPFFHKFVITDTKVPYRAIYPDAIESQWKLPKKDAERTVNVLQLRDANIEPGQLWERMQGIAYEPGDDEDENEDFLGASNVIRDLPLLHQVYKFIEASKEVGVSVPEAIAHFGQTKLNGRAMMKNLIKDNIVEYYTTSNKRQTVRRYILPEYNKKRKQSDELLTDSEYELQPMSVVEEDMEIDNDPLILEDTSESEETTEVKTERAESVISVDECIDEVVEKDEIDDDASENYDEPFKTEKDERKIRIDGDIIVKVSEMQETKNIWPKSMRKEMNLTDKTKERIRFILREIKSKQLFDDTAKLGNALKREESLRGLTDIMCRKTFFRLLTHMCQKGMLRLWRIEFQYKSKHRVLTYVTDKDVDASFSLMQSYIEQAKVRFRLNILEEECRKEGKQLKLSKPTIEESPTKVEQGQRLSSLTNHSFNYGITPKFVRLRTLHEFLFYLARSHEGIELTDQAGVVDQMKGLMPREFSDIEDMPTIWCAELGWKMFIPPLIKHNGFDIGWCLLSDCIFRMPLSVFIKVINIPYEIKGLDEYVSHPLKKHFLVRDIPLQLQQMLFARRKYIAAMHDLIRRLICIGLVQAGPHRSLKDQAFFYMNRYARLIDTSCSQPGTYYVSEEEYSSQVYNFKQIDDVFTYWDDMHRICMSTKLNRKPGQNDQTPADKALPNKFLPYVKAIQPRQAKDRDLGELPGDNRGAAGLDSYFFAHLERNWAFNPIKYKLKPQIKPKLTGAPLRYSRLVRMTRDSNLLMKKHESRISTVPLHKLKSAAIRRRMPIIRKKPTIVKKKKVRAKYDDIDRMALQHMNKLRVDWNEQEDNFLLLCKVAQMYLNPSNRLTMPGQIIRDLIHWHCKSLNKTSFACRRRITYITKKLPNSEQINNSIVMCLNEIKGNKSIQKRFGENFIRNLKKVYPDEDEFNSAFKVHFIDLVHTLSCQFYNLTNSFASNKLILPRTLQEFNLRFIERTESVYDSNTIRYEAPENADDIKIATIVTLIHSTVCCGYDKTSWSLQLYEIYKDFPEGLLSLAMRKVRSDQLISQNKINSSHNKVQNRCLPLSSSGFHLSATYQQQMTTKMSYDLFDDAFTNINDILTDLSVNKQAHILNLSHSAVCFFISELAQRNNGFTINIELPKRVLLLDPSKRLPDESFEGIYARFHEIFNYIPKVDLPDGDEANLDDFIAKLPKAEEKPTPVVCETKNIISKLEKLPSEMVHFFCIVDQFGASKPRNQFELDENGKCPFDCLKNSDTPWENINDKLMAKREIWYRLNTEQFQFDPLPAVVVVDETNIVAVYNYLVLKGATATDEQRNANLELFKQVSDIVDEVLLDNDNEFIDEDFGAEYDLRSDVKKKLYDGSQINDKIHKFHDFLCVNTCKLSMIPKAEEVDENGNTIDLKLLNKKRDDILAKIVQDSNWSPELKTTKDIVTLLQEKEMDMNDINIAVDVYNYIDTQGEMGARADTLVERYEDKFFLQQVLDYFNEAKLVMKTGICEVTYVHAKHIKSWVVYTYHLKRLDRDSTSPSPKALLKVSDAAPKRKISESDSTDAKRPKLNESSIGDDVLEIADSSQNDQTEDSGSESSSTQSSAKLTKKFTDSVIEHGSEIETDNIQQTKKTFPLRMSPWTRVNGSVNRRVIDKYAGTMLLYCIENVGLTLFTLCTRFHYLLPIHVHEIVQILEEYGCVTKTAMTRRKPITLFSKYESVKTGPATDLDDFRDIIIEPTIDAVTKMTIFIGDKKYKEDFI